MIIATISSFSRLDDFTTVIELPAGTITIDFDKLLAHVSCQHCTESLSVGKNEDGSLYIGCYRCAARYKIDFDLSLDFKAIAALTK